MNADPAVVESTSLSLKLRRNCTAGEASEPKVAVAMTHLGGAQGAVAVLKVAVEIEDDIVVDVTRTCMINVIDVVVESPPPVPVTMMNAVVDVAVLKTANESVECTELPDGGVTGFGAKPPETPTGNTAASATGELKPPKDCTVTSTFAVPAGFRVRLLGLADRIKEGVPVTVKGVTVAADFPVLPTTRTVYGPGVALDDTTNPMLAFPPPVIVHETDERIDAGAAVS
jgi:hypothetical protein